MPSFLLTWNPKKSPWPEREDEIQCLARHGRANSQWSVQAHRMIRPGDSVYLMRVGKDAGIVASGVVAGWPFKDGPWEEAKTWRQWYAELYWAFLLPRSEAGLPRDHLEKGVLGRANWASRRSGRLIPRPVAAALGRRWTRFLAQPHLRESRNSSSPSNEDVARGLGPKGRRLLHILVAEIERKRVLVHKPKTYVGYAEALELMGIPPHVYPGRQLDREGMSELNEWTKRYPFLPKVTGLIVSRTTNNPGSGYASSNGQLGDWKPWWRHETARAIRFDWTPYLVGPEAPRGSLANDVPQDELPKRIKSTVSRIVRDTKIIRELKALYRNRCQICRTRLKLAANEYYSEGHHLRPLGSRHGGFDVKDNVICVCPNYHALLDRYAIRIEKDTFKVHRHAVRKEFIEYHNAQCRQVN